MSLRFFGFCCAAGLAAVTLLASGCAHRVSSAYTSYAKPSDTAVDVLIRDKALHTFVNLVKRAELTDTLENRQLTIFAPTNEAFQQLPADDLDRMSKDPAYLTMVLKHHLLAGASTTQKIEGSEPVTMVSGKLAELARTGDYVSLGDALVFEPNIPAGRSIIQKVDRVVLP